jgi:hypothetical protein
MLDSLVQGYPQDDGVTSLVDLVVRTRIAEVKRGFESRRSRSLHLALAPLKRYQSPIPCPAPRIPPALSLRHRGE